MNFYQFHIGDYIKQTVHLTPMEDICYRRLIDMYYETEQPIPVETDRVSRRLRLDTELVDSVLKEFFTLTENGWENARCNKEIDTYHIKAGTARANGKLGGRPKKTNPVSHRNLSESGSKANQEPITNNQEPITNNQEKPPEKNISDDDIRIAEKIFSAILAFHPKHKEPNIRSWANDIRLMRERDGRTAEEISSLFAWANNHQFWRANILCPSALRKQWDKLEIQRANNITQSQAVRHENKPLVKEFPA